MKLIEALVVAQQEYGIYGDWKAIHSNGCCIGRAPRGVYLAFDLGLISQSYRLETVVSGFGEKYPHELLDEHWKVSRWEERNQTEQETKDAKVSRYNREIDERNRIAAENRDKPWLPEH